MRRSEERVAGRIHNTRKPLWEELRTDRQLETEKYVHGIFVTRLNERADSSYQQVQVDQIRDWAGHAESPFSKSDGHQYEHR
jgi:hypothetical protein